MFIVERQTLQMSSVAIIIKAHNNVSNVLFGNFGVSSSVTTFPLNVIVSLESRTESSTNASVR